jgi:MFS family permease
MIARLYPVGTGRALGWVGVGASIGFFIGPIYAGWRAQQAGWRAPVLEFGLAGMIVAGLFVWLAEEDSPPLAQRSRTSSHKQMFPTGALWLLFVGAAFLFGLRDFAGASMGSLGSLFLQKAHGFSLQQTGFAIGAIFLASAISNPLFGHLSDRGRIRWTMIVLSTAAVVVVIFPRVPSAWLVFGLAVYGFFFMSSYPMVEAALMESVPDAVRGRVFGLFITIGGLTGNLSHWIVGRWVKGLGPNASDPASYQPFYLILAGLMIASLAGLPCLHGIRRRESRSGASLTTVAPGAANPQFE